MKSNKLYDGRETMVSTAHTMKSIESSKSFEKAQMDGKNNVTHSEIHRDK